MSERGRRLDQLNALTQRLRWPVLVLIVLLGVTASTLMARQTYRANERVLALTFGDDVEENLVGIAQAIDQSLEQVRILAAFIRSARQVDRREFASFVLPTLRRYPTIHSLGWVPRIAAERRQTFEEAAGIANDIPFRVSELDEAGKMVSAGEREVYYPLTYAEPRQQLAPVLGFDVGSDPVRLAAMQQAAEAGRLAVTAPLTLVHEQEGWLGFIAFVPLYRGGEPEAGVTPEERIQSLLGFTAGGFIIADVVENAVTYWRHPDLQVYVFDTSRPAGQQLLYARHDLPEPGLTAEGALRRSPLHATRQISVGGRTWLAISTPTAQYLADRRSRAHWAVLAVGLTLTGLVGVVLGGLIRSSDQMAEFARSREEANAELRERIQEREEAEQALEHANRELRQINADMERFVGAVSHDLKSPLIAAEMLISVMRQAVAKNDMARVAETSAQISKACARMRRIIDDLLEHQRAGWADLRSSPVDLVEVALHVVEEHREESQAKGVHVHLQDDLPTIRADRGRVTAMLDNLFSNALKYGVNGQDDPAVTIGWTQEQGELRLFVQDNGPGIPEPHRERMWEMFQRLSKDEEGTGIGLAIVRRVAEAHGGRTWIECPPEGGTTFWVAFPTERLVRAEARRSTASPQPHADAPILQPVE